MNVTKLLIGVLLVIFGFGCSAKRDISLSARKEGTNLVFDIKMSRVNGLLGMDIWQVDPNEYFWKVNLNYFNDSTLTYGQVPSNFRTFNGALNGAEQEFPNPGIKPRALAPNKTYCIALSWQNSDLTEWTSGALYFLTTTDSSGAIVSIVSTSYHPPPPLELPR